MQPLVGTLYQLIDQARSNRNPQAFRGLPPAAEKAPSENISQKQRRTRHEKSAIGFWLLPLVLLSATTMANRNNGIDVVVPVSPEILNNTGGYSNNDSNVNCPRCCIYDNRSYSEGAVVKAEGVLLQCSADKNVLSTNNLKWVVLKKG